MTDTEALKAALAKLEETWDKIGRLLPYVQHKSSESEPDSCPAADGGPLSQCRCGLKELL